MGKVAFVLTGFSTFHGVDDNPTECLMRWMKKKLDEDKLAVHQDVEVGLGRLQRFWEMVESVQTKYINLGQIISSDTGKGKLRVPNEKGVLCTSPEGTLSIVRQSFMC